MDIRIIGDSLMSYGVETIDGETVPYCSLHVVSFKYTKDGALASRTETTTRTYVDEDEDEEVDDE